MFGVAEGSEDGINTVSTTSCRVPLDRCVAISAILNSAGGMGEGGLSTPEEGDTGEGAEGGIGHKTQVLKTVPYRVYVVRQTSDAGTCRPKRANTHTRRTNITRPRCLESAPARSALKRKSFEEVPCFMFGVAAPLPPSAGDRKKGENETWPMSTHTASRTCEAEPPHVAPAPLPLPASAAATSNPLFEINDMRRLPRTR